jgi:hypothetical protein
MTVDEAYRAIRREYSREYYRKNSKRILFLAKRSRMRCHAAITAYKADYRAKNREKIRAYDAEYGRKNRARKNASKRTNRARRARLAGIRAGLESSPMAGVRQGGLMGSDGCNGAVSACP